MFYFCQYVTYWGKNTRARGYTFKILLAKLFLKQITENLDYQGNDKFSYINIKTSSLKNYMKNKLK